MDPPRWDTDEEIHPQALSCSQLGRSPSLGRWRVRSVRRMHNRLDSRHRLAGLRTSVEPPSGRRLPADESILGGWIPESDEMVGPETDATDFVEPSPATQRSRLRGDARRGGQRPWGRLAQRWVPEPLRDSRLDPGRRGALLLTLVAAIAALVAAVGVWRDRPEPRPVQSVALAQITDTSDGGTRAPAVKANSRGSSPRAGTMSLTASATARTGAPGTASASVSTSGLIVVSVTGAVSKPGLVRLAAGSRVADAIEKAGGATAQANITGLNLAEKLSDGASVVVSDIAGSASSVSGSGNGSHTTGSGGSTAAQRSGATAGKLDLNTADVASLDALPGVGPVTAAAIVAWREKNGRFAAVEQLQEIQGIGPAKYAALAELVKV